MSSDTNSVTTMRPMSNLLDVSALTQRVCDQLAQLSRGAEVRSDPVLRHGKRDPGCGAAARNAAAGAADAEHGGRAGAGTQAPDRVTQPPPGRHAENLVGSAHRYIRGFAQTRRWDEPHGIHLTEQGGIHAGNCPRRSLASSRNVRGKDVLAVAKLRGWNQSHRPGLEHGKVGRHRRKHSGISDLRVLEHGEPVVLRARHTEVELVTNPERTRNFLPEDLRDRLTGGAANDLSDEIAERVGVIADLRARLPPQLGVGDRGAHLVPVAKVFCRRVQRYAGHAGRVAQDVAHRHLLLAVGAKLRPDVDERSVIAEQAALGEDVSQRRGRAFDDREVVEGSVRPDRPSGRRIGDARDGVDDQLAAPVDRDLYTPLNSGIHEDIDGLLDTPLDLRLDLAHATASPSSMAISFSALAGARRRDTVRTSVMTKVPAPTSHAR